MIEECVGVKLSSNDILGVEYIKAAKKIGVSLEFFTVKRMGNAYRDNTVYEGEIPSASAIRDALMSNDGEAFKSGCSYTDQSLKNALAASGALRYY